MSEPWAPERSHGGPTRFAHGAHVAVVEAASSKRRNRLRLLTAMTLLTAAAYYASLRKPLGPDAGAGFHPPAAMALGSFDLRRAWTTSDDGKATLSDAGNATLRIGTFNIHGAKGTDGVRDLERVAHTLRGLDFAGLNEVHGAPPGYRLDQAAALGEELGMAWLFAPTEERWWCDQFGNGALSAIAVTSWQRIPLPRVHGKSYRNALLVRAAHQGRTLNILVTHLDRSDDRERVEQLRTVGELFLALEAPAMLLGDLNTDATEPALRRLLDAPGVHDPLRDRLGDAAPRRIDWILVRGLETVDAGHVRNGASDHPHVWAELAWPTD